MKTSLLTPLLGGLLAACLIVPAVTARSQEKANAERELAAALEKAKQYTEPGPNHKVLERFVGDWNTELRIFSGDQAGPATQGSASARWLMPGRWIQLDLDGTVFGKPMKSSGILGYDNFKQSFVMTVVHSTDTAMLRAEGDLSRDRRTLTAFGTMDEYLTGEHDKMAKYIYRFVSPDEILFEVHDLVIGEPNTRVIEIAYRRKK
ncbi:MAG: DUF1579 domain-containing protein [Armatimonadetes bacterium]|nr:DUF1579 domain-containing protein [Armatimonadota bacterium]